MPIDRTEYDALVNDSGSNADGTLWTKEKIRDVLLDPIDELVEDGAEYKTSVQTTTLGSGANNNLSVGAAVRVLRLLGNADGTSTLTGLTGGADGRILTIFNVHTFNITLKHLITSTTGNLLVTPNNGADFVMGAYDAVDLWYDVLNVFWRVKAF